MPRCSRKYTKGHKVVKSYADGGEVKSDYPKPTYVEAVKDRVKEVLGLGPKHVKKEGMTGEAVKATQERHERMKEI